MLRLQKTHELYSKKKVKQTKYRLIRHRCPIVVKEKSGKKIKTDVKTLEFQERSIAIKPKIKYCRFGIL